jgi:hypothetical protein
MLNKVPAWIKEGDEVVYQSELGREIQMRVVKRDETHLIIVGLAPNGVKVKKNLFGKSLERLKPLYENTSCQS